MGVLAVIRVIAVLLSGLMAGILFGDRMGASFARPVLSASSFVQLQQIIHGHFVRMMPALTLSGLFAGLAWLFLARPPRSGVEFWLVGLAVVEMVVATALTRVVNVPINNQLMTWSVTAPPANLREVWSEWERIHSIRTVLWMLAFGLEAVSLGLFAGRR